MVKYRLKSMDRFSSLWTLDISHLDYAGEPIPVRGYAGRSIVIKYDAEENPFSPIIYSNFSSSLIDQGNIDIEEFQSAGDRDFTVQVYKGGQLYWTGFVVPDRIKKSLNGGASEFSFTALDGLKLLEGMDYIHNNLPNPSGPGSARCILNYVRQILFSDNNLGLMLPITWVNSVTNTLYEGDVFTNEIKWSPGGEGYTDFQGNYKSCGYVLENMLKAFQCRIFQSGGKWHIRRINDVVTGEFELKECSATLGVPTITTAQVNINRTIEPNGDYRFIRDDQNTIMLMGLKKVGVTYSASKPDNIIPNGGFDNVFAGAIYEWALQPSGSNALLTPGDSLNSRTGRSADIAFAQNDSSSLQEVYLTMYNSGQTSLPIDAKVLFKTFRFGFTFCPLKGFTFDADTGHIIWDDNPLRIRLSTVVSGRTWVLSSFGYWIPEPTGSPMAIYNKTVTPADQPPYYNRDFYFNGVPVTNEAIRVTFDDADDTLYSAYVGTSNVSDLPTFLEFAGQLFVDSDAISVVSYSVQQAGDGQYMLRLVTAYSYDLKIQDSDVFRDGSIAVTVDNMKIGDVAKVTFEKWGDVKFIEPPQLITDQSGLEIRLYVKRGQKIIFDDVYVTLEENNDLYISESSVLKNSASEEVTLEISSSFSGCFVSNIMTGWSKSDEEYIFTDGKYTGSLTGLTANAMMRFRYLPSRIFEGTVYGSGWTFDEIYSIQSFGDKKFIPLKASYNTEGCEIRLTACECRDDNPNLSEKHIGSNDQADSGYNINS